ncbi:MAG: hypothetical protein KDA69_02715 [Planctomycetaceae bacterium]|nr:hypothetical protein [Planctomycetaceae bacterium]MCA9043201.1 hypothetical protein [Planctomycetaceae bacterium]
MSRFTKLLLVTVLAVTLTSPAFSQENQPNPCCPESKPGAPDIVPACLCPQWRFGSWTDSNGTTYHSYYSVYHYNDNDPNSSYVVNYDTTEQYSPDPFPMFHCDSNPVDCPHCLTSFTGERDKYGKLLPTSRQFVSHGLIETGLKEEFDPGKLRIFSEPGVKATQSALVKISLDNNPKSANVIYAVIYKIEVNLADNPEGSCIARSKGIPLHKMATGIGQQVRTPPKSEEGHLVHIPWDKVITIHDTEMCVTHCIRFEHTFEGDDESVMYQVITKRAIPVKK